MCPGAWKKRYVYAVSTWGGYIVSYTQTETREGGQTNAMALTEMNSNEEPSGGWRGVYVELLEDLYSPATYAHLMKKSGYVVRSTDRRSR